MSVRIAGPYPTLGGGVVGTWGWGRPSDHASVISLTGMAIVIVD
jgi:membrane-associated phospholipid phosphatase